MKGKVYLIGAGPGDYKLMTLKGMEIIRKADIIYYDRLVNPAYLKEAKENCELVYVGKESSNHSLPQEEINRELAQKAKDGKLVARLKGGDPYVFGRGGEEGETLYNEGIDFEVVPGITSAIGGLCYAGIPITHRDYASSFHVITGHLKDSEESLDWKSISTLKGTLVFLMGIANLQGISENLRSHGRDSKTPVAVINWATRSNQRVVTGTLENIFAIAHSTGIKSPSLIVVGEVVNLRQKLNFFEKKPLIGKNIVVTRSREQSSSLVEKIEELGGNAVEIPTIKIKRLEENKELEDAINTLTSYKYIIFTSVTAVEIFFEKLFEMGRDSRALAAIKITVVGSATGKALQKFGLKADIEPKRFISEEIVECLKEFVNKEDRILIPRAKGARAYLTEELGKFCSITEVKTYETVIDDSERYRLKELIKANNIDYITFTSSSTVDNFITLLGKENLGRIEAAKLISIGPITSKTMQRHSLEVYKEAKTFTIEGLMESILEDINIEE